MARRQAAAVLADDWVVLRFGVACPWVPRPSSAAQLRALQGSRYGFWMDHRPARGNRDAEFDEI